MWDGAPGRWRSGPPLPVRLFSEEPSCRIATPGNYTTLRAHASLPAESRQGPLTGASRQRRPLSEVSRRALMSCSDAQKATETHQEETKNMKTVEDRRSRIALRANGAIFDPRPSIPGRHSHGFFTVDIPAENRSKRPVSALTAVHERFRRYW